ncbi:MAG TPA: c-type cytochrome, partial [Campylobacterales bacterium]|nr:c-type cytochrome [Campylobacterales bacterium]
TEQYMTNVLSEYKKFKEEQKNKPAVVLDPAVSLADSKGCLACHAADTKLVGPSYKEVAAKYKSADEIVGSIQKGSKGKWGAVEMPAQTVTPEEAKQLAEWVMKQK